MASAGAQAYNPGLWAEPPAGSRGRAPSQWVRSEGPLTESRLDKMTPFDPTHIKLARKLSFT